MGDEGGEVAAVGALVGFGEFEADGGLAVAEGFVGGFEGGADAEGGLEADEGVGEVFLVLEEAAQCAGLAGGEAFECEAGGGEAGHDQGYVNGGGAGDDIIRDVLLGGVADEAVAGVADAGVAAVGAEGDVAAVLHGADDALGRARFVALAVGNHLGAGNVERAEQGPCAPRVFAGDEVRGFERL